MKIEKSIAPSLVVLVVTLLVGLTATNGSASEACNLIVTEHWPVASVTKPRVKTEERGKVFEEFGVLLNTAYQNGGYVKNPTAFPVHHTDFRDDHIVIQFRTSCARGRLFLNEL